MTERKSQIPGIIYGHWFKVDVTLQSIGLQIEKEKWVNKIKSTK